MSSLKQSITRDYRRYRATGTPSGFEVVFLTQGFWATSVYRLTHRVHLWKQRGRKLPGVSGLVTVLCLFATKAAEVLTGISLQPECEIGEGLYIGHYGMVILNGQARLGRNCNLSQGVTLGCAGRGENRGAPVLGDRVYVGTNAIVIGRITVGDDAAIGAGAVVTKSVPARAVVAGNPARVLSYRGSFDFIRYDGMEHDPARVAALNDEAQDCGNEPRPAASALDLVYAARG